MLSQQGSAGLISRYNAATTSPAHGTFNAYLFDASTDGTYTLSLIQGCQAANTTSGQRDTRPTSVAPLATGAAAFAAGTWHTLSLSVSGSTITARADGQQVAAMTDTTLTCGAPGIEVDGWYPALFSNLAGTSP